MRRIHLHRRRNITLAAAGLVATLAFVGSLAALAAPAPPGQGGTPPGAPQATEKKQFEVASVKPNKSGENRVMLGLQPGGRFTATNVPLRNLITNAFRIQGSQLVGGPGWLNSDRFDIAAKAEGNPSPDEVNLMIQSLLAERFGLVAHRDTRDMPVYALMVVRPDAKLGDRLKPASVDCDAVFARGRGQGALPPPPAPGAPMTCGMRIGPGILSAGSSTMTQLAQSLGLNVGRIVQDKTGLTGRYDIDLSWTPEGRGGGPLGGPGGAAPSTAPSDGTGVSIFTAVQEQLGLKLDAQRGQVDVLVIDQVMQPTPD